MLLLLLRLTPLPRPLGKGAGGRSHLHDDLTCVIVTIEQIGEEVPAPPESYGVESRARSSSSAVRGRKRWGTLKAASTGGGGSRKTRRDKLDALRVSLIQEDERGSR